MLIVKYSYLLDFRLNAHCEQTIIVKIIGNVSLEISLIKSVVEFLQY